MANEQTKPSKAASQVRSIVNTSMANFDLNEMALFTQVVESGGFTPAAKKSGVPLSTVSRKMTNLEERLGVRLIQRSTRHIHLTEVGEAYYKHCRDMLDSAIEAEQCVQNASAEPSGTLRMATPFNLDSKFSSSLLAGYLEQFPKMNVEIHRYSDQLAIIDEGFDCALYFGKLPDSNNVVRSLGQDKLILCASDAYLEKHGEPLDVADLENHIGLAHDLIPKVYDTETGETHLPLRFRYSTNDPVMVKRLAIDGVGICYMPQGGVQDEFNSGELKQILPDIVHSFEMSLVYPGKRNFSPKLDSMIDYLLKVFEGGVPWEYGR